MKNGREAYCKCLYYSAHALSRNITRMAERAFEPLGLAPSYAFILMTLNKKPGINAGELAAIMQLQPSTVTRLIERLEEQKYIHRVQDGKFVDIFPLRKAMDIQDQLITAWHSLYQDYTELLGEEQAEKLTEDIYAAATRLENQ